MPNDLNKILENSSECLSNETLRSYLEGDPQVQHRVEEHLVDCELCNSALEGYTTIPAFSAIPDLNRTIRKIATEGSNTSWLTYAGAGLVGAAIVFSVFMITEDGHIQQESKVFSKDPSGELIAEDLLQKAEQEQIAKEDANNSEPLDETILKRTVAEQPVVTTNTDEVEMFVRGPGPEKIVTRKTGPLTTPNAIEEDTRKPKIWSNVHVAFVHDLVVVDYSRILTTGVNTVEERYGSLHPQFENEQDRTIIKFEPRTYNIPYLAFMEDAMSGFAAGQPSKTLTDLEILLKQHNDDVNGLFYSGLCLYHMDRPDLAIPFFDKSIGSSINTFYEEAKWYKALSLIRTGDKALANDLFNEIVEEGGFYADRAQKRLNDIN